MFCNLQRIVVSPLPAFRGFGGDAFFPGSRKALLQGHLTGFLNQFVGKIEQLRLDGCGVFQVVVLPDNFGQYGVTGLRYDLSAGCGMIFAESSGDIMQKAGCAQQTGVIRLIDSCGKKFSLFGHSVAVCADVLRCTCFG